jgi:2-polyprenyl-3-methyl-5-hydroxy-6-metoxy-1,4-benzoquinol methylase
MKTYSRACPVCRHKKNRIIYVQKFSDLFTHNVAACRKCGFVFISDIPDESYYRNYYAKTQKYEFDRGNEYHEKYADVLESCLKNNNIPKSLRILDVGCGNGQFLSVMKRRGYANLLGLDPAPPCRIFARKHFGITIETDNVYSYRPKKKFDLVTFNAVLEHVSDPKKAVACIASLMSPDGYLFLSLPDAYYFLKNMSEPFSEFSTEHINFFSSYYLFKLMDNFNCVHLSTDNLAIYSLWQKREDLEKRIRTYVRLSKKKMDAVRKTIDNAPKQILVWGAGALSQKLLLSTPLKKKVVTFIDRDPSLWGTKLAGINILSPREISQFPFPILISSYYFKDEITEQIKKMGLKNKIITF